MRTIDIDNTAVSRDRLVLAYNAAQDLLGRDAESHVRKFRDSTKAVMSVQRVRDELVAMHGYAALLEQDDGSVTWSTERPAPAAPQSASTDESSVDQPESQESATVVPEKARVGKSTIDLSKPLTVLSDRNPKRAGSRAHEAFELYTGCSTGEEYAVAMEKAGKSRKDALSNLHWDIAHKFVRLG